MAGMTLLAADQLDWYVGKPWAMIIDVRNRREYEKGHVKGAVNLPYDHLLERVCLPRDKILVICCERGAASMAEGKRLAENGYEVKTVIGGMHAYRGRHLVGPAAALALATFPAASGCCIRAEKCRYTAAQTAVLWCGLSSRRRSSRKKRRRRSREVQIAGGRG